MTDTSAQDFEDQETPAHEQRETITIDVEYPEHAQRTESAEFSQNKRTLVHKLNTPCFCCEGLENREVHHWCIEWAEWENADPTKVLRKMHQMDIYGYAALYGDKPVESPDDIRNLVVICAKCHRGKGTGIHLVPFPNWISQVVAKKGVTVLKALR